MLPAWVRERVEEERRQRPAVLDAIRDGVRASDPERFVDGFLQLDLVYDGWRPAMRAIRKCPPPAARFRRWFRDNIWLPDGDHIRSETGDDLLLADALRVLLPPYRGQAARLWRGDSAWNRRCRTYGLAWSRDAETAHDFARSRCRMYEGGCVVLETRAPAAAIICIVPASSDRYAEREALVDRRRLSCVQVVARYGQIDL
jgi:hypothetical protein